GHAVSPWAPAQPLPPHAPHGRIGSSGGHPVWYAERLRGRRASHGRGVARRPALHSLRPTAAPAPGECPAGAGRRRRGSVAGELETQSDAEPSHATREWALAVLAETRATPGSPRAVKSLRRLRTLPWCQTRLAWSSSSTALSQRSRVQDASSRLTRPN